MRSLLAAVSCVLVFTAAPVLAQTWSDNFDSYPLGPIVGQGGWEEWTGSSGVSGVVTSEIPAHSGTKCLKIEGRVGGPTGLGNDTVHRFTISGGQHTFAIWTYCPSTAQGQGWIIHLNQYPSPLNWSSQTTFNHDLDLVTPQNQAPVTLIEDRWVEYRMEIDLDNDLVDFYYDGVQIATGVSWRNGVSGNGQPNIACLDLYGDEPPNGTTGIYYDDASLRAAGGLCGDMNCDSAFNGADIDPFFLALGNPAQYAVQFPNCNILNGDTNHDGVVNGADIDPFFIGLAQGACPP